MTKYLRKETIAWLCPFSEHSGAKYGIKSIFVSFLGDLPQGPILEHEIPSAIAGDFDRAGVCAGGVFYFSAQPSGLARARTR